MRFDFETKCKSIQSPSQPEASFISLPFFARQGCCHPVNGRQRSLKLHAPLTRGCRGVRLDLEFPAAKLGIQTRVLRFKRTPPTPYLVELFVLFGKR